MNWPQSRIGDYLTESAIETSTPSAERRIRVRLNAEGIEKRPLIAETEGATRYFQRKAGQFIFGKQNLHKGAFGVIPPELDGFESSSDLPAFDVASGLRPKWLEYFLKQGDFYKSLVSIARGAATKRIQPESFFAVQFPVPPVQTQDEIIKRMDLCSFEHTKLESEITHQQSLLLKLRQAILQEATQGDLTIDWRTSHPDVEPASQLLRRIDVVRNRWIASAKDNGNNEAKMIERKLAKLRKSPPKKPSEELPDTWEWATLIETNLLIVDCHNKTAPYQSSGIPIIRTTNVRNGILDLQSTKFVSKQTYQRWTARCVPLPGDLIFTREAPVGEVGQIPEGAEVCLGQRTMLIRPLPDLVLPEYLLIAIQAPGFMKRASRVKRGAMVGHLRVGDVETTQIPLPPLTEQAAIVAKVEALMRAYRSLEEEITHIRTNTAHLLQAVLKEAFAPAT